MKCTLAGMLIVVRVMQLWKASLPMEVRPSGKVREVRAEQPQKVHPLIKVRPAGKVRAVRAVAVARARRQCQVVAGSHWSSISWRSCWC